MWCGVLDWVWGVRMISAVCADDTCKLGEDQDALGRECVRGGNWRGGFIEAVNSIVKRCERWGDGGFVVE